MPPFFRTCAVFSAVSMSVGVAAQDYPIRPIRIVVAQAPASGPDLTARAVAQKLTESWGQQVVVENRAGANGIIGGDLVADQVSLCKRGRVVRRDANRPPNPCFPSCRHA